MPTDVHLLLIFAVSSSPLVKLVQATISALRLRRRVQPVSEDSTTASQQLVVRSAPLLAVIYSPSSRPTHQTQLVLDRIRSSLQARSAFSARSLLSSVYHILARTRSPRKISASTSTLIVMDTTEARWVPRNTECTVRASRHKLEPPL